VTISKPWPESYQKEEKKKKKLIRCLGDEQRPRCRNCISRDVNCEYGEWEFVSQVPPPVISGEGHPQNDGDQNESTEVSQYCFFFFFFFILFYFILTSCLLSLTMD
jgi:hypothetical protein